jgi:methionyl aminopeptidase
MGIPTRAGTVTIKRPEEIARMRHAGSILADILEELRAELRPGVTTGHLDEIAERRILEAGAVPSFLNYHGTFPGSICASINDEVVHGIPSRKRRLYEGDVVSLDIGCIWQGWHADCARTWSIGPASPKVAELMDATRRGMEAGIAAVFTPGTTTESVIRFIRERLQK